MKKCSGIVALRIDCFFIFSRPFKSFWSFLIIITVLINNSWMFCSLLNFLHFDLLSGDGGTRIWTIFICHYASPLLFRFTSETLLARLLERYLSASKFSSNYKQPFCSTFPLSEGEESSADLSRCGRESPSLNRFRQVYWKVMFFSQYCLQYASKQPKKSHPP